MSQRKNISWLFSTTMYLHYWLVERSKTYCEELWHHIVNSRSATTLDITVCVQSIADYLSIDGPCWVFVTIDIDFYIDMETYSSILDTIHSDRTLQEYVLGMHWLQKGSSDCLFNVRIILWMWAFLCFFGVCSLHIVVYCK